MDKEELFKGLTKTTTCQQRRSASGQSIVNVTEYSQQTFASVDRNGTPKACLLLAQNGLH
jgi:hypothetical protein